MEIKAGERLLAQTKVLAEVDPDAVPQIKHAMSAIVNLLEDAELGSGGRLGTVTEVADDDLPGLQAPIGVAEVYFNANTLRAAAKVLDKLNTQEEGFYNLGFEVKGGKLVMCVIDAAEL